MTDPRILLCYRRKSCVQVASDEISLEKQTAAVEALAQAKGFVIEWYADEKGHKSGRYEEGRDGWQTLKAQLPRPDVAGVGAFSLSRVYRNVQEFLSFLDDLERNDKSLVLVKENIDTSTAIGRAIVTILMTIYQLESDLASERRIESIAFLREEKGRHWGHAPYGCDRHTETKQLIPSAKGYWYNPITNDTSTNEVSPGAGWEWRSYHAGLITVYQIYLDSDLSYDRLAVALNEAGWRFKNLHDEPREFGGHDTRRVIKAWQLYAGDLPLGRQKDPRDQPVIAGGHDPIIPKELALTVGQKAIARTKRYGYLAKKGRIYLLGDVLYCATCGQALNGQCKDGKRHYKHRRAKGDCPEKWILADDAESFIIDMLVQVLTGELLDVIRSRAEDLVRAMQGDNPVISAAMSEIKRQKDRLGRLTDIYVDGEIDKRNYLERKGNIDSKIAQARSALPDESQIDIRTIIDQIEKRLSHLCDAKSKQKKAIINWMIARAEVSEQKIKRIVPSDFVRPFF